MFTKNFEPFEKKVWITPPTRHREKLKYFIETHETKGISIVGENQRIKNEVKIETPMFKT